MQLLHGRVTLCRSGVKRRWRDMAGRGRPITTSSDRFQSELLKHAKVVSAAYRREFGRLPESDSLIASLLRARADWGYSAYKVTSLVTMISKAKTGKKRGTALSAKVAALTAALRAGGHAALAAKIEKQCRHVIEAEN